MKRTNHFWLCLLLSVLVAALFAVGLTAAAAETPAYAVGDHIQFGNYPQTQVDETPALQAAAQAATWKSYGYYSGTGESYDGQMQPGDYMRFADFLCESEKYRAVTFSTYRPIATSGSFDSGELIQEQNGFAPDTVYYFKYEPLSWRVLDPANGFVLCEGIIDAQPFQNTIYFDGSDYYQAIGSAVYANNYAKSTLRTWLNRDFFATAFTDSQKAAILTTALNNDASNATFNAEATNDKIFLLSYAEATTGAYGFNPDAPYNDEAKQMRGTDYAYCQGLRPLSWQSGLSCWWLRSPKYNQFAAIVSGGGSPFNSAQVSLTDEGVVPACRLSALADNTAQDDFLFSAAVDGGSGGDVIPPTADAWGYCGGEGDGTNLVWTLNGTTLTVSGTGTMADYHDSSDAPWAEHKETIQQVTVAAGVASIGGNAFSWCKELTAVSISDSVTSIGNSAFASNTALTELQLPNSILHIAGDAFSDCANLVSINIPGGVIRIENNTFSNCRSLASVAIPTGVTSIGSGAFYGCESLKSVIIPEHVTIIDDNAFAFCRGLNSVFIPVSVERIGWESFELAPLKDVFFAGTPAQNMIAFGENNTSLLSARWHYNALDGGYCGGEGDGTNLVWVLDNDGTLTVSGTGALPAHPDWSAAVRRYVKAVVTEEGVTAIGMCAFTDLPMKRIVIAASVTEMENGAFLNCEALETLTLLNPDLPLRWQNLPYHEGGIYSQTGSGGPVISYDVMLCGYLGSTTAAQGRPDGNWPFTALCPTDVTHSVREKAEIPPTCTAAGHTAGWYCEDCGVWLNGEAVEPRNHRSAQNVDATNPTAASHGFTAGVYCPDCSTWLSGHEVIHNQLGERTVIKEATETEEGEVIIVCTVCSESGLYALEKLQPADQPAQPEQQSGSGGFFSNIVEGIRRAASGFINVFLRLIRWLGGKK